MPQNPTAASPAPRFDDAALRSMLLRGFGIGAVLAVLAGLIGWLLELPPPGQERYLAFGIGTAIFAALGALWWHGRFLAAGPNAGQPIDGRLLAGRLQGLLGSAMLVKLGLLAISMFTLHRSGVKFDGIATFCIAFAAGSLLCQLTTAGYLSRRLGSPSRAATVTPAGSQPATEGHSSSVSKTQLAEASRNGGSSSESSLSDPS